jgi:penicillin-binding protein 2
LAPGSSDSHFNKALQEHYAPGSTFKLVTATAWLLGGGSPARTAFCPGSVTLAPGFTRKCNVQWGHGTVDLRQALMVSCNVYFYGLAKEMRQERLYSVASLFGYGRPTRVALLSQGESGGVLTPPEAQAARFLANRVMMGIGQGELISVTPLQQAMAYSAMANGGVLYAPRLVLRVELPDGKQIVNPPVQRTVIPWTEAQRQVLLDGFRAVVEVPRGTAHKVGFDPVMRVAGKTGTAQRYKPPDAWFIGFAPWDNPEICVAVLLEKAGHGGEEAGPVAKKIFEAYFGLRNKPPADLSAGPPDLFRNVSKERKSAHAPADEEVGSAL